MRARRSFLLVLALASFAWAADGIEVLSQTDLGDGIEVLCKADQGVRAEAYQVVNGVWTKVDGAALDLDGLAALRFSSLEANQARIILRAANGDEVSSLLYAGDGTWTED